MPGTPINQGDGILTKLQTGNPQDGQERDENEVEHQQQYRPDPSARELTQTDKLNKRLLESLLERMSKSDGEFDRFMEEKEEEEEATNFDEESGEF